MASRRVRASELATFTFCQRAWYYSRTGASREEHALREGAAWHEQLVTQHHRSLHLTRIGSLLVLVGLVLGFLIILR